MIDELFAVLLCYDNIWTVSTLGHIVIDIVFLMSFLVLIRINEKPMIINRQ